MKQKRKQFIALSKVIVLSFIVLFCMLPLINTSSIVTNFTKLFKAGDEVELDNWEISTVFYDSTVNDGQTPLTEINWDNGTNHPYMDTRTIVVQINYKNSNSVQEYKPGDLIISFNNIMDGSNYKYLGWSYNASANSSTNIGEDWNCEIKNAPNGKTNFVFTNVSTIEKNANFEGSIQIVFTISPRFRNPDKFDETNSYELSNICKANINDELFSNELLFTYSIIFEYNWKNANYTVNLTTEKIKSYDGLPNNATDYIWVKCKIISFVNNGNIEHYLYSTYPNIRVSDFDYKMLVDEGAIAYDDKGNSIDIVNSSITINDDKTEYFSYKPASHTGRVNYIYIGYPKEHYSDDSIHISVDMIGTYENKSEPELLCDDDVLIQLSDYEYNFDGLLYSLKKSGKTAQELDSYIDTSNNLIYQAIQDNSGKNYIEWNNRSNIQYTGTPIDIIIGDDYVFASDINNNLVELEDEDYYFSKITIPKLINNNESIIEAGKYTIHLYVRYKDSNNYEEYASFENKNDSSTFTFNEKVMDWYVKIDNMNEGLLNFDISARMFLTKKNINETGSIYNYSYLKVYGNNSLLNSVGEDSYTDFVKGDFLKNNDSTNSSNYIQRAEAYRNWSIYVPYVSGLTSELDKTSGSIIQNSNQELFSGSFRIYAVICARYTDQNLTPKQLVPYYTDSNFFTNYHLYDLLPLGVELASSKEEIINSISTGTYYYDISGNYAFSTREEASNFFKQHATVNIKYNWKNTGRTLIHIAFNFPEHPLVQDGYQKLNGSGAIYAKRDSITIDFNHIIKYDSLIENGRNYKNFVYGFTDDGQYDFGYHDNGEFDHDAVDINENNSIDDPIRYSKKEIIINSVFSTHQDVQVSVQNDESNFDTGKVEVSNDSEYFYKLRARTGSNDITNLVIYDSLEKYAKDPNMESVLASGGRRFWQGEFLGIDTSYAESKGYTVKTYYSESETPGSLKDDDSWKVYTDSVEKTKVKSLAFEYLDSEGNPAVLPANSLTYVLIKMKSPADENIKTLAYNGCWTEWNAIDPVSGDPVDFITGINSNIVKVALPNSVEPVDIDFDVHKYWKDNNNELDLRPDSITIQVVPDGDVTKAIDVPLGSTNVDSNNSNHWYTTIQVPKYDDDGNTIAYTLREDEIILSNGYKYTPEITDNSITNKLVKEIVLKKRWVDNTNSYLTRPGNITYNLKRNGNSFKQVTITGDYSSNEWSQTTTVDVFDSSNNKYEYSIDEVNVNNYSSNCEGFTCTNKLTGKETINVKKDWKDNNNSYNTRPNEITIKVLQNGNQYKSVVLNSNNNWNSDVEVDKYDSNGRKYTYTVLEEIVEEYGLVTYDQNNYKVTNTLKANISITITKNWIDDNNSSNTRPNELTVTLLQNGEDYREITLSGDGNTWTKSVEVPKYDDNQKEYKYSIKEINTSEEYSDITYEDDLTVTNKLSKKTDLTIKKKWIDQNNDFSSRPNEVNIELLRDGELFKTLILNGNSDTWESVVKDVEVYDDNGKKYNYTIREDVINKYEKVTYDQTNLEVTNELTDIPKVTLYFTVVNGYVDPKTGKMKYDEFGLNEILKKYNKTLDDEYIFKFRLENTDTHKTYDGKLSTKGILEFKDIPYGDYKAVVGKDKLFEFVDMLSIKEVNGVSFKKIGKEGYISIKPTGENIIFGAKIINRIVPPINNPKTGFSWLILLVFILPVISFYLVKNKKEC